MFLFCLVLLSCENHSFIKEKNKSLQDSISLFIEKANNYELPEAKALEHLVKAESLVNVLPKDSLYFKNKVYVGFIYYNLGNKEKYKTISFELINDAIEAKDSFYLARAYSYIGDYYTDKVVLDSAVIYYQNAEKVYFGIKDNIGIGRMHVKMATAKFRARDYLGSEKSAVMALTYIRLANNKLLEYEANSTLGLACVETKDYEKADEYFQKAYKIAREENLENLGQYQSKAISLNNLGFLNLKSGKYKEALNYFNQANQDSNLKIEFPELYATILDNKAKAKLKLGDFSGLPGDFLEPLKIRKNFNLTPEIVNSKINLSEYYQAKGIPDSAKYYAQAAYDLARKTNILNLRLTSVQQLSKVDPDNESSLSKEQINLTDSLLQAERQVSEKFARIAYETDEFKRQKERLSAQNQNIIVFSLLGFLLIILLYVVKDQRSRNYQFKLKESQQRANEEIFALMLSQQKMMDESVQKEKQRIGQELHDGVLGRLFGARLNLDSANRRDDEKGIEIRNHYINELKYIEQDIREISHELNRERFALINNFVAIITNLFEEQKLLKDTVYFSYTIDSVINWDSVPNNIKINVYRIIQEALQNINKYAEAKNVSVAIVKDAENIHVSVIDDGVGFDTSRKSKGIGLQNIESRVKTCKGKLEIKSKKGKGTSISIDLPIHGS
ncbi:tetratricopeptide repeat-containing sensor histidine kinase [Flavobacterium filum]|uniref:tetratricopeptide repeat-containing sensor histidine kinase n=1 Tax=Flavobacterium filum TaxID=370974 RepID=UPI00041DDB8C|nr:ATP-binding protein [Flavobacterium filum]